MWIKNNLIAGICILCLVAPFGILADNTEKIDDITSDVKLVEEEIITEEKQGMTVYVTPTGKRYHFKRTCAGKNAIETTIEEQKNETTPCKKCAY